MISFGNHGIVRFVKCREVRNDDPSKTILPLNFITGLVGTHRKFMHDSDLEVCVHCVVLIMMSYISYRHFPDIKHVLYLFEKGLEYAKNSLLWTSKAQEVRKKIETDLGKLLERVWALSPRVRGSLRSTHRGMDE